METQSLKPESSPANLLAVIGGVLIVVALIGLVSTRWDSLSSLVRVLLTSTPTVLLLLAGLTMKPSAHVLPVRTTMLITALLAFPFSVGVVLYEYFNYPVVDANFYMAVFGLAAIASIALEHGFKLRPATPLTLMFSLLWLIYSSQIINTPGYLPFGLVGLGVLSALASRYVFQETKPVWAHMYVSFSLFTLIWGAISLPDNLEQYLTVTHGVSSGSVIPLAVSISGSILLGAITLWIGTLWQKFYHSIRDPFFAFARRNAEILAGFTLIVMPTIFGIFRDTTVENLGPIVALLPVLLALYTSYRIHLASWRLLSWIATVVLLMTFVLKLLEVIDISFSLILLVIGILLFVTAYVMTHRQNRARQEVASLPSWHGLGEPLPETPKHTTTHNTEQGVAHFVHDPKHNQSSLITLVVILLGMILLINFVF